MLRRLYRAAVVMLVGAGGYAFSAQAADPAAMQYVAARFPPYTLVENNQAAGPTALLLRALAAKVGHPASLTIHPLARALAMASNEANVLIAMIARTPERETQFRWVCPVQDYDVAIFRLQHRTDVVANSIPDLARFRVMGVNRDIKTSYLQRQGLTLELAADEDEAMRLLLHGRIDAMPSHPPSIRTRLRELGERSDAVTAILPLPELTTRLYLAFGMKTSPETAALYTAACEELLRSGAVAHLLQPAIN